MRFDGEAEWKSMLLGGVANSAGLLLIVMILLSNIVCYLPL